MTTTEIILLIADSTNALLTLALVALVAALAKVSQLRTALRLKQSSHRAWENEFREMQRRAIEGEFARGEAYALRDIVENYMPWPDGDEDDDSSSE